MSGCHRSGRVAFPVADHTTSLAQPAALLATNHRKREGSLRSAAIAHCFSCPLVRPRLGLVHSRGSVTSPLLRPRRVHRPGPAMPSYQKAAIMAPRPYGYQFMSSLRSIDDGSAVSTSALRRRRRVATRAMSIILSIRRHHPLWSAGGSGRRHLPTHSRGGAGARPRWALRVRFVPPGDGRTVFLGGLAALSLGSGARGPQCGSTSLDGRCRMIPRPRGCVCVCQ